QHYLDFFNWLNLAQSGRRFVPVNFPLLSPNYEPGNDVMGMRANDFRLTAIWDYKLSEHWRTRQAASFLSYDLDGDYRGSLTGIQQAADGTWMYNLRIFAWDQTRRQPSYQSDFLGSYDFDRIGGKLSLLAGADINSVDAFDSALLTTRLITAQPLFATDRH